jgi:inosine-uridine nucleoside N-ribohydrolase
MPTQILVDTDPGVDDALALFFGLGAREVEVAQVTTCCGNFDLDTVTRNAQYILDVVGASTVPVSPGARRPRAQLPLTSAVHGKAGLGGICPRQSGSQMHGEEVSSSEAMRTFLSDQCGEARTLVALAPLTNIADVISTEAHRFRADDRLVILGGAIEVPGNKGPVAEFNFRCDPEAADLVLGNAPCRVTVIPLDLCMRNVLSMQDLRLVRDPAFRAFLRLLCEEYASANAREEGIDGIIMYDPLAMFCATHPNAFTYEQMWMRVDTGDSFARGMSVIDRRLQGRPAPNVSGATSVDWCLFVETFFGALNSLTFDESFLRNS